MAVMGAIMRHAPNLETRVLLLIAQDLWPHPEDGVTRTDSELLEALGLAW